MADDLKPALIIVDVQEDFCPPDGSLAVPKGRDIAPLINELLTYNFSYIVATQDWHPRDHISFASNHKDGENERKPFEDFATVVNPHNSDEKYEMRLWPVHCVQNTKGAEIIPELKLKDDVQLVKKGMDSRVEMYSAFYDPLQKPRISDSGLSAKLKERGITDVYVVGLALDYCVKATALDAVKEGYRGKTYLVEDACRAVDKQEWEENGRSVVEKGGVTMVTMAGPEVRRVIELEKKTS